MYIRDGVVVVGNKCENNYFIYDKDQHIKYQINKDMLTIIKDIQNNQPLQFNDYLEQNKEMENVLYLLHNYNIITENTQKYEYKIKQIRELNSTRMFIECTNKCNLACPHCYGNFGKENLLFLDIEVLETLIRKCAELNVYEIDLTGGEPFLHPQIERVFQALYKYGMLTTIFSNLTVCSSKQLRDLKKYGIKCVITSIESFDEKIHDNFRGLQGAWRTTKRNISILQEQGIEVKANFVLGAHNIDEAEKTIEYIRQLGIDCNIDVTTPEGRARVDPKVTKRALNILKNYIPDETPSCGVGKRMLYVAADGSIYLCPSIRNNRYLFGNIYKEYDLAACYKKAFSIFGKWQCQNNCQIQKCSGGCRARALLFHKDLKAPDDYYCDIFQEKDKKQKIQN